MGVVVTITCKQRFESFLLLRIDEAVKNQKSDGTVSPVRRLLQIPFTRVKSVSFFMYNPTLLDI